MPNSVLKYSFKHVSDKACWAKKRGVQSKMTGTEASNTSPVSILWGSSYRVRLWQDNLKPGMSKVQKAQARKIPTADIHNIRNMIIQIATLKELPPVTITNFSADYQLAGGFNGILALREKSEASYCSEGVRQPSSAAGVPKNTKRPITIEAATPVGAKPSGTQEKPPTPADGRGNSSPSNLNKAPTNNDTKDFSKMTCKALSAILKDRGLKASGKKAKSHPATSWAGSQPVRPLEQQLSHPRHVGSAAGSN
ncbi:MAG: hypothetical protein SGBAC_004168 [Bacillariaceae sp.]